MAGNVNKVKTRIVATKKTAQITKAMNMISASKLKNAENAIKQYRPFIEKTRDIVKNDNINAIGNAVREILKEKIDRYESKGMHGKQLRAMIVGIPNVGKSSLVNRLSKSKKAKVEDRPGVTLNKQWVTTDMGFELLDMPGVLWPKFEDVAVGEKLAFTGAIKDEIMDLEEIACRLLMLLKDKYPQFLLMV